MSRLFLAIFVLLAGGCQEEPVMELDAIPEGTGIDLGFDRARIDQIINSLNEPTEDYVLVASHRGDWHNFPENTIEAFESAINAGADIIEIDVRKTSDGHLVVIHDSDLDRTTTGSGDIDETPLSFIKTLFTLDEEGNQTPFRIPTLEEVMLFAKGKAIVMIDKANDHFEETLQVLLDTKTIDHALFIEPYTYAEAQSVMGQYLFEQSQYVPRIKENVDNKDAFINPFLLRKRASAVDLRFSTETAHTLEMVPVLQEANTSIWINTIDPEMCAGHDDQLGLTDPDKAWGWCLDNVKANVILTDYPRELTEYLISNQKRN